MVYKAHIPSVIAPIVTTICIFRNIESALSIKYGRTKNFPVHTLDFHESMHRDTIIKVTNKI